jgi:hypothetical protein
MNIVANMAFMPPGEKRRQAAALQDAGAVARDAGATRRQARLEAK